MKPGRSLVFRVGGAAAGLAVAATVLLGLGSYAEMRSDIIGEVNFAVAADASVAAKETAGLLRSVATNLRGLAANGLVANALLDNLGRDVYLAPFLKGFGRMTGIPGDIVLTDFSGRPIAPSGVSVFGAEDDAWVRKVVASGKSSAKVMAVNGESRLLLAEPVVYINTGLVEGALVLAVPLDAVARNASASRIDGVTHALTVAGGSVAWSLGEGKPGKVPPVGAMRSVDLPEPLAAVGLKIVSTADPEMVAEPLRHLALVFAFAALTLVAAVTAAAAALARQIVAPIQQLEAEASSFDFHTSRAPFKPEAFGDDEIGRLAVAFRSMEQRLSKTYAEVGAANRELEAFSFSVSHDLRAPLRAIDGYSQILLEDYRDKLDDEGKRMLGKVRDNTERMAKLIDDILSFSRMGRVEMTLAEIDLGAMAREVFAELTVARSGGNVRLSVGEMPPARGDRTILRQVMVNLLSNAVKFTRHRAEALIEVGGRAEANENTYFVKDNGVGFDMQYVDRLFGVFQRLHGSDDFEGTGIGLAIVKRIVERHGGRVWAEGRVGEGATFHFTLPAGESAGNDRGA